MALDDARQTWLMAAVETAAETHILPRFRALAAGDIRSKSTPDDLVTEADLACEAALTADLARHWPEALVVGEEAVSADPRLLDRIGDAETCVILDPVDGTWNFANGLALFGVIVAVTRFGVPVWGGLYDPMGRDWIVAGAGQGCRFVAAGNSRSLTCGAARAEGGSSALAGCLPLYLFKGAVRERLAALMPGFGRVSSLRCTCHEYRLLTQGRIDFLLTGQLNPWDHAAGALAVAEAGGTVRMLDGSDYSAARRDGVMLAARDEATWSLLAGIFSFLR